MPYGYVPRSGPDERDEFGLSLEDFLGQVPEAQFPAPTKASRLDQILASLGHGVESANLQPQGLGQGLLAGLFQGLGNEGLRRETERQRIDASAQARAERQNQANLEATRAYRAARTTAGQNKATEDRQAKRDRSKYEQDTVLIPPDAPPWVKRLGDAEGRVPRETLAKALEPKEPRSGTDEPLVAIETPDGPRYVRRSGAVGQSPAKTIETQKPRVPTAAERDHLTNDLGLLQQVDDIRSAFQRRFTGPVGGTVGGIKRAVGLSPKEESAFRGRVAAMRNQVLKARSGGAVTDGEAQRLLEEIPVPTDPDFMTKLRTFESMVRNIAQSRRDVLTGTGVDLSKIPELPRSPEDVPPGAAQSGSFKPGGFFDTNRPIGVR